MTIDNYLLILGTTARGQLETITSRAKVDARNDRKNAETIRDRAADVINNYINEKFWKPGLITYEEYIRIAHYYLKQIKRA